MIRRAALLLAVISGVLPLAASAELAIDLRSGYAIPYGKISGDVDVAKFVQGHVPLGLNLRWRFTPRFSAGAYLSYGFGLLSDSRADKCSALGAECTASDLRTGLEAELQLSEGRKVTPYLGARFGWESFAFEEDAGINWSRTRNYGWELGAEGGATLLERGPLRLGAFLGVTVGSFYEYRARGAGLDASGDVTDRALHGWVTVGVRASISP